MIFMILILASTFFQDPAWNVFHASTLGGPSGGSLPVQRCRETAVAAELCLERLRGGEAAWHEDGSLHGSGPIHVGPRPVRWPAHLAWSRVWAGALK